MGTGEAGLNRGPVSGRVQDGHAEGSLHIPWHDLGNGTSNSGPAPQYYPVRGRTAGRVRLTGVYPANAFPTPKSRARWFLMDPGHPEQGGTGDRIFIHVLPHLTPRIHS